MIVESEPKIIPSQIRRARTELALSIEELASLTGLKASDITSWEEGETEPTIEQLWELAQVLHRSTDYFFRSISEMPEKINFRLKKESSLEQLPMKTREAIIRFSELCRAEYELEKVLGKPHRVLIEKYAIKVLARELASNERKLRGLGDKPIRKLRDILTRLGVRVFMLPIEQKEFSGMSWWHNEYGPCILVNAYDTPYGRRSFTMAHEYAHLISGQPPSICDLQVDTPDERYANVFASNFLIPEKDLREEFNTLVGKPGTLPDVKQLGMLASRYSVSLEAISRRLESLNLILSGSTDKYIAEWSRRPRLFRGPKGPKWKRMLGNRFVSLALNAHSEGQISLGKLANLLDVDVRTALKESEQRTETTGS